MIGQGDPVRDFSVLDIENRPVSLAGLGGHKVLLSFYRYASCPLCNHRLHRIAQRHESWSSRGLRVVAVFQSPPESILKCAGRRETPFTLIADPDRTLYDLYRVPASWMGLLKGACRLFDIAGAIRRGFRPGTLEGKLCQIPADFLINPDQTIFRAYYGRDIGDHIPFEDIEAWLRE